MNKTKLTIKDSSLSFIVGFLLCQIAVVAITIIGLIVAKFFNISNETLDGFFNTATGHMILSLTLYLTMLMVFLFFNKNKENKITQKVKLLKILKYIGIATLAFFMLYPIVTCIDSLIHKIGLRVGTLSYKLTTKNYFISLISLVVAPAVCEELLFRGLIFKGLKKHGKVLSITISALMFAIYHMSVAQTIYPLLMGLLFGVIMFYENNIYYCIAAHTTNNFISLTLSYFEINLIFNHWTYILLAIILAVVFICIALLFILKNKSSQEKQHLTSNEKIYLLSSLGIMILFWIITLLA